MRLGGSFFLDLGTASVTLELRVDAHGEAPTGLQYPMSDVSYAKGTAIAALTPSVQGTQPMTFTIEPALPAGLSQAPATGTLSGTPTTALARTAFTVTARNMTGAATVTLHLAVTELLEPLSPGQAAGVRQGNVVGPNGPTGAAGVVTNGILIDVTDSFDGAACEAPAGSSLSPSSGSIAVGESLAFRLASTPFHSWINSIAQQNAPAGDVWPSAPCLLLGNVGSTCVIGVNHGG